MDKTKILDPKCWGGAIDQELWSKVLTAGGEILGHEMWCAVIETVAESIIAKGDRQTPYLGKEDQEERIEDIVSEWLSETKPIYSFLVDVLDNSGYEYFNNIGHSWQESIGFSGAAHPFHHSDITDDLRNLITGNPEGQESITKETVEEYYAEWRTGFLRLVLEQAQTLASE